MVEAQYIQEEEYVEGDFGEQEPWMVMAGIAKQVNDSDAHDDLAPRLDPHVDWVEFRVTPEAKFNNAKK